MKCPLCGRSNEHHRQCQARVRRSLSKDLDGAARRREKALEKLKDPKYKSASLSEIGAKKIKTDKSE